MTSELSKKELDYFNHLTTQPFKDQAIFYLNCYWDQLNKDAEKLWDFVKSCREMDKQHWNALPPAKKGDEYKEGTKLDEFWSHKLLENYGKPMSVVEFRQEFKKIDLNFDKHMSLLELCVYWFQGNVSKVANYVPGAAQEVRKAQELLDQVEKLFQAATEALDKATKTDQQAQKTKDEATKSEAESAKKATEAKKKADEAKAAEAELKAALDELKAKETAHAAKTKELETKAESGSGVSAMRAKNELAQHLSEDPLPLRQAKLTTEAATKKAEKARVASESTRVAAEEAANKAREDKVTADAAAEQAQKDRQVAEEAVAEGQKKVEEAEEYLNEQKKKGGGETLGTFWWLDRELQERKKYMPKSGKEVKLVGVN